MKALKYSGRISHHTSVHSPRMYTILCQKKTNKEVRVSIKGWDSISHTYDTWPYGQRA